MCTFNDTLPFVDFKKAYDSIRREVLYNILIESVTPMKMVRLIQMCLNETYSRVRVSKHLSDLSPLLFNFALEYPIKRAELDKEGLMLNCAH